MRNYVAVVPVPVRLYQFSSCSSSSAIVVVNNQQFGYPFYYYVASATWSAGQKCSAANWFAVRRGTACKRHLRTGLLSILLASFFAAAVVVVVN